MIGSGSYMIISLLSLVPVVETIKYVNIQNMYKTKADRVDIEIPSKYFFSV